MFPKPNSIGNSRPRITLRISKFVLCASVLLCNYVLRAQTPANQLHFAFNEASGTNSTSDTSLNPSAIVTSVGLFTPAGTAMVNLHGAAGSGVEGAINGTYSLDFTSDLTPSQTNQPANSGLVVINGSTIGTTNNGNSTGNAVGAFDLNDGSLTNLGTSGVISSFVATIWLKLNAPIPNGETVCPRIWILNQGATGADTGNGGNLNQIGLKFQQNNQVAFSFAKDNPTVLATIPSGTFPTGKWLFFAVTYDGTNAVVYYGTDTASVQSIGHVATNHTCAITGSGCLAFGNRHTGATTNARGLDGWLADFRLYTGGVGTAAFVENIRQQAVGGAPTVTGIYPDGLMLQEGTNTLTFTASSPAGTWGPGTNIGSIQLLVNGVDVSSNVVTSGPSNALSASYTGLPQNMPAVTVAITVTDVQGRVGTGSLTFDAFSPTNFTWEAEEFDFINPSTGLSGQFLDNALYTSVATNDALGNPLSYFGLDSTELVDTHKGNGNLGLAATDYRVGATDVTKTQTPAIAANAGELLRLKFINDPDTNAVDHQVANTANPDWQNYTKTFPAGLYNVYGRFSGGSGGNIPITLALVTGGQGTTSQTISNLGVFTYATGGFQYAPLRDSFGNLATVNLGGTNTVRTTWGSGGSANFYMLVQANTNLPTITGVYPDGIVLFEATNKMVFTASSGVTTINTNSIHLSLNGTDVSSNLVFTGGPSTWNVAYNGLSLNSAYAVIIRVTDANGGNASTTLNIDTYNPILQFEGEDFDFDPTQSPVLSGTGLRYIDNNIPTTNAQANSYFGQIGNELIDENGNNNGNALNTLPGYNTDNYRVNDRIMCSLLLTDAKRAQFLATGASDYNLGFLGNGFWTEYTRTWPSGTYNVYGRLASGNGGTIHIRMDDVIAGWGTTNQLVMPTEVGIFNCPGSGGYGNYLYVPMIDRFGNYANVTLGGTNTFRMTVDNPININFYMLLAARTDLPRIDSVYPDGSLLMQRTNTFSFVASSPTYGISTTNIHVTLNGVNISSSLLFSGSSTSWNVSYPALLPNTSYTAVISVTDAHQQSTSTTVTFDTFSPNYFTWEAEDFDFSGGQYIDNPSPGSAANPTNSYYNQIASLGIDINSSYASQHPGTYLYRPSDNIATEVTSDAPRQRYLNAQLLLIDPTIADYDIFDLTNGGWINYTHTYPSGNFHVYGRLSAGNGTFNMQVNQVTNGWGTATQSTSYVGTFSGTGASFTTWQYVPLINTNNNQFVTLSLGGTNTFQITPDGNENANFFMLIPVSQTEALTATFNGLSLALSFATQSGFTYTVEYKNKITDSTWTVLGSVPGDGTVKTLNDPPSQNSRFYRLLIQ